MRIAFGTFLGAPDPISVFGDAQYVRPRFAAQPDWAFVAERDGKIVGSNFAARWGSFGFLGPLSVHPEMWDQGIATRLMEAVVGLFDSWQLNQTALFTFPESPRHIGLYQKFGYWPQYLTPVLEKPVSSRSGKPPVLFSRFSADAKNDFAVACRSITDAIFPGLDLSHEIRTVDAQQLGDTVLLGQGDTLDGFAVCHLGRGEAGGGTCYIKFGAVGPGSRAKRCFENLLDACELLAASNGLARIVAGVNASRHGAYKLMLSRGFRAKREGIIMQRPNRSGYCQADAYVIDDLR
jgi:GNAT superfamily N-acetyltransferase